jgi:hypothetical protein
MRITSLRLDRLRSVEASDGEPEPPLYPRGPRSGPGSAVPVHPHLCGPIRPTRRHSAISLRCSLYALPSLYVSA